MNRRDFLKIAGVSLLAPHAFAAPKAKWNQYLVMLELKGGNDGINTLIPFTDPLYYESRPNLAIDKKQILQISPKLGFHPSFEKMREIWGDNELAIVQGVGYPKPNRSHFRSIEIWETASNSNEFLQKGWLAQLFESHRPPEEFPAEGIIVGSGEGPLDGTGVRTINLKNPKQFFQQAKRVEKILKESQNNALSHLLGVQNNIFDAAKVIQNKINKMPPLPVSFPGTKIGKQLEMVAKIIIAKIPVAVFKVSHGSFDTHGNQKNQHARLLKEMSEAVHAFRAAIKQSGQWNDTMLMTYSEFGRRVRENGSNGTDHGTAAPHFFMGGRVQSGLYGKYPSLGELSNGDLQYKVDFRSLYSSVVKDWWQIGADPFPGHKSISGLIRT